MVSLRHLLLASLATTACSGVLGLEPPALDPCVLSECVDGSPGADAGDAAPPGDSSAGDAARDAGGDVVVTGMRCGGGAYPVVGCAGQTPICCQETDDAGTTSYQCRATASSCAGYPITCTSNAWCPGTEVCCHYNSGMKCVGSTTCANTSLVCDPNGAADQCPTGYTCGAALVNDGVSSPFFACTQ